MRQIIVSGPRLGRPTVRLPTENQSANNDQTTATVQPERRSVSLKRALCRAKSKVSVLVVN